MIDHFHAAEEFKRHFGESRNERQVCRPNRSPRCSQGRRRIPSPRNTCSISGRHRIGRTPERELTISTALSDRVPPSIRTPFPARCSPLRTTAPLPPLSPLLYWCVFELPMNPPPATCLERLSDVPIFTPRSPLLTMLPPSTTQSPSAPLLIPVGEQWASTPRLVPRAPAPIPSRMAMTMPASAAEFRPHKLRGIAQELPQ